MNAKARGKGEESSEPIDWPSPTLRVTLHWDGESWTAGDAVRVPSMTLPNPSPGDPGKSTTGFWVSARDAEGRLRYRTRLTDPLRGMEVFEESGEMTRVLHKPHDVDIEVVVPDGEPVTELEIVSNSADRPDTEPYSVRLEIDRRRVREPGSEPQGDSTRDDHHEHDNHDHH